MELKSGQTVRHDGKLYQILKIGPSLITAHSYDETCGIESTILVSISSGNVVARKAERARQQKCNTDTHGI